MHPMKVLVICAFIQPNQDSKRGDGNLRYLVQKAENYNSFRNWFL